MTAQRKPPSGSNATRVMATFAWVALVGVSCTPSPPGASSPPASSDAEAVEPEVHEETGPLETQTRADLFEAHAEDTEEFGQRQFLRCVLQGQMGASGTLRGMQSARAKAPQRIEELTQRSAAGDSAAMYALGVIDESGWGEGDGSSIESACEWFQRAGELGHTGAMVELALLYLAGYPSLDLEGAFGLLEQAASLGDEEAAWRLKALRARKGP